MRAPLDLGRRAAVRHGEARPRFFSDSTWCFQLLPLPADRARLVVSGYAASHPRAPTAPVDFVLWEPVHRLMQTRQFANLKQRAEGAAQG